MNQFDQAPVNGEAIEESIAIVCNGNTAPKAIAAGQYLFIKNHSTLATGGYHATDAIASGDTLSSSNVTSDPDGIANAINGNIPAVVNNLTSDSTTDALSAAQGKALNDNIESIANNLNASKMRFCIVRNSDRFTFDCGESSDATAFVFSGNQSVCGYFDLGLGSTPTVTYRDLTGTTSSWTISKSGTTITLTRTNGTMWGMACLIVALR